MTSQTNFTVVVEPDFLLPDIIMQVWDGKTVKAVTPVAENGVNVYYIYDEDYESYICDRDMDEDEVVRLMTDKHYRCPYFRNGDEYAVVRKQM